MSASLNYTVVIETDEDGVYIASCPALPGAHSHGRTREEAIANVTEAIELVIEDMRESGEPIPTDSDVSTEAIQIAG